MKKIDLHMHTVYSDGTDNIKKFLDKVVDKGIEIFAITDHDTIDGCREIHDEYTKFLNDNNLKFINGIEFSTQDDSGKVHILAYNFDVNNQTINDLIVKGKMLRIDRILKRFQLLESEFGIVLSDEDKQKILSEESPSKVHIANWLNNNGYPGTISEIVKKYLYHNMPSDKLTSEETIKAIKSAGALAVVAHPLGGINEKPVSIDVLAERIKRFVSFGLDGLECYYSLYSEKERSIIAAEAMKYGLKLSGGSDYHGTTKDVDMRILAADNKEINSNDLTILKLIFNK